MIGRRSQRLPPGATPPRTPPVSPAGAALLLVGSLMVGIGLSEVALRLLYRDEGRTTLGGPGNRQFYYETRNGELRGRRDVGPKRPGVPRIMIVGDSITYGQGVRDWRDTWPELLAQRLERSQRPNELAVFASPGSDMPQHVDTIREWSDRVAPDVFIYQWYVNDIEAIRHGPDFTRVWQRWPWHRTLRSSSYLFPCRPALVAAPAPARAQFRRVRADGFRARHLGMGGIRAPVPRIRDARGTRIDAAHHGAVPSSAVSWSRSVAADSRPHAAARGKAPSRNSPRCLGAHWRDQIPDAAAPWKQMVTLAAAGAVVETPEYVFSAGPLTVDVAVQRMTSSENDRVATVELVDATPDRVVQATDIPTAAAPQTLSWISLTFPVAGEGLQRLRLRVRSAGPNEWSIADLRVPVDYDFEVVDLTEPLNTFETHASSFDAHPNEAAHRVIAEQVYRALVAR